MPATPQNSGAPSGRSFAAFVAEDQIAALRTAAEEIGLAEIRIVAGRIADAVTDLARRPTPDHLVVDLSDSGDAIAAIGALSEVCDAGTKVLAIGDVNDVGLYRSLIRHGVQDYLVKPVSAEVLRAALDVDGRRAGEPENETGKLVAVVGTRGGVGATAVASNLAWVLANEQNMRVALVDLDLFFGSCALTLDLEMGRGFREAMENPARIDSLFIERSMVRESDRLYVLSTEESLDAPFAFDTAAIDRLLEHLRRDFQCVVIDFPRFALRRQTHVLTQPASAVLISDASLAGMRDTMRLNGMLKAALPAENISVCLNRVGLAGASELSRSDFEKGAQVKVSHSIPADVKAFAASMATGKPVLKAASRSRAAAGIRDLARCFGRPRVRKTPFPALRRLLAGAS
jgi:pilus assembly protein CpaE